MARARKPLNLQRGNLTVLQQINKKEDEKSIIVGKDQLAKTPLWLVDIKAKKEYKRLIKELDKIDTIGNLDLNNLGCYCNAYSLYLKATKELMEQTMTLERLMVNGEIMIVENPLINIQKKYAEEMRKFASTCGLTIDSRLKVATTQTTKKGEEVTRRFGDI